MSQLQQVWDQLPPVARFAAGLFLIVMLLFLPLPIWLAVPLLLGGVALALVGGYGILVGDVQQSQSPRVSSPEPSSAQDDQDFADWNDTTFGVSDERGAGGSSSDGSGDGSGDSSGGNGGGSSGGGGGSDA